MKSFHICEKCIRRKKNTIMYICINLCIDCGFSMKLSCIFVFYGSKMLYVQFCKDVIKFHENPCKSKSYWTSTITTWKEYMTQSFELKIALKYDIMLFNRYACESKFCLPWFLDRLLVRSSQSKIVNHY